ncbi:winged helix-turn-helix domain-containing protein [Cupriavidus basilensis]|uniref:winged helix-turn-helix domain-containing protein n=1 Tax=Cupriavidus basilensis TaxID=68895 RepID=UPI00157B8D0E|nr:LysR family transcriptional regulator [Cupriavidus basilensis]NUA29940.1 LysR family transcriptional regulator [Cupriavidus basilensis]
MKPILSTSPLDEKTRFRVQIKHAVAIGPGKADVLEGIAETGSIAEAGRRLGMSYQRVWTLVAAMNADFVEPLVHKQRGGVAGGGAQLTPTGVRVLEVYRAIERDAERAVAKRLPQLLSLIRPDAGKESQSTPKEDKIGAPTGDAMKEA